MNTGLLFVTLVVGFGLMIMGLFSGDRSDRTRLILVVAGVLSLLATLVIGLLGVLGPGRANIVEWQPAGVSQGFEARVPHAVIEDSDESYVFEVDVNQDGLYRALTAHYEDGVERGDSWSVTLEQVTYLVSPVPGEDGRYVLELAD